MKGFTAVAAEYPAFEQVVYSRNMFPVFIGVNVLSDGFIEFGRNDLRIDLIVYGAVQTVDARVLLLLEQGIYCTRKERFSSVEDASFCKFLYDVADPLPVGIIGEDGFEYRRFLFVDDHL